MFQVNCEEINIANKTQPEVNLSDFDEHISHESNEYYPTSSDH